MGCGPASVLVLGRARPEWWAQVGTEAVLKILHQLAQDGSVGRSSGQRESAGLSDVLAHACDPST